MIGTRERRNEKAAAQATLDVARPSFLRMVRTSVFAQFILLLVGTVIIGALSLPSILKIVQPEALDTDELMCKVPDFVASKQKYDVVFMGSSLVLAPAVYCDSELLGKHVNSDEKKKNSHYYSKALYFEKLLGQALKRDVSVYNLGLPGCMMADDYVLFEEILKSRKVPSLVVVGVAPRDFMMRGFDPDNTPVQKALRKFKNKGGEPKAVTATNALAASKAELDKVQERVVMLKHLVGNNIDLFRKDPLGRKSKEKEQAFEDRKTAAPSQETMDKDLQLYNERYNPPDLKMVQSHLGYLERLLKSANDADVPIVIVNMPITGRNRQLLDPALKSLFENGVKDVCTKYGVKFMDFDANKEFKLADHSDSVHLNLTGGQKFYQKLTNELSATPALLEKF